MWRKIGNSKVFYAILAFVCAVAIWLYVDIVEAPNTTTTRYNIPVEFMGEDVLAEQGLMITEGKDTTVTLTLTGPRTALSQLTRSNITITVQAAYQISGDGNYSLDYSVNFPGSVNSRVTYKGSVSKIDVTVVQMTTATVEILGNFDGTVADGAVIDENGFLFENTEVTVTGERSLVEQVDHAQVTLSENDLSTTWAGMLDIELVDADGEPVDTTNLSCSIDEVYTTFPVQFVKEVPLTVDFSSGGGATVDDVTYSISPETVMISGTREALDAVDEISIGTVDLSKIVTSDVMSYTVPVPDDITLVSGVTTASVTVSVTGLVTRAADVSNIQFTNVPEGLDAESLTLSVTVRIRGAAETMALVVDSDVILVVDLAGMDETDVGIHSLSAAVSVVGFADVGAVGDYQVVVNLTKAEPDASPGDTPDVGTDG